MATPASSAATRSEILPPLGLELRAPAFETRGELNTTAAGDSFTAGLLAGLLGGVAPEEALRAGDLAAALHIEGSPIPSFDTLLANRTKQSSRADAGEPERIGGE